MLHFLPPLKQKEGFKEFLKKTLVLNTPKIRLDRNSPKTVIEGLKQRHLPKNSSSQVIRVFGHLALIAAAGELATHFGITEWETGVAADGVMKCFSDWLKVRGGIGMQEEQAALDAGTDALRCIKFELKGRSEKEEGYGNLLCAKIFETFGVYNPGVAANALTDCVNCIVTNSNIMEKELEEGKAFLEKLCENVLSLFQEMRPRDVMELMMVTKLIILDYLSNREFIGSVATQYEDRRTGRQLRAIKLSRLLLEFKDKLDKHRKPEQQIHVQHNHIHNEGQAIIGSQISTGGGMKFLKDISWKEKYGSMQSKK